jgi:hypothetical protein
MIGPRGTLGRGRPKSDGLIGEASTSLIGAEGPQSYAAPARVLL